VAKATPRELALRALSGAVADPVPRPLLGTKAQPGIFTGSALATKAAAALCQAEGWVEPTGEVIGKGKSRKELWRVTATGVQAVVENDETATLLREMLGALDQNRDQLERIKSQLESTARLISTHRGVLQRVADKAAPPRFAAKRISAEPSAATVPSENACLASHDGWLVESLRYLEDYQRRHPLQHCPLAELYERVARPHRLSIGMFHDGLRKLAAERRIRLHPFTGAAYQLQNEQYALVAGQEIKYYAEHLGGAVAAEPVR
jgi:hypothetical protein